MFVVNIKKCGCDEIAAAIATGCSLLRLTQQVDHVTNYENYHSDRQNLVLRERRTTLGTLVYGLKYFPA